MSRVLVIGSENEISRAIAGALSAADFPNEYSAGHADTLQRLRLRSFGIVVTSPVSTFEEDLALLEEMQSSFPPTLFLLCLNGGGAELSAWPRCQGSAFYGRQPASQCL